jgi:ABC-type glycerol-3-phosphate transport system permease component
LGALRKFQWGPHLVLLVLLALTFYPVILMIFFSFKSNTQFFTQRYTLSFPLHVQNYAEAWSGQLARYMLNSVIYATVSVILTLIPAGLAAYAFARMRFYGKEVLFYLILGLLMIPGVLTLVPAFVLLLRLDMLSTRWAFWLPYAAGGQAFAIFVLRTFFSALPEELFESARIDGATEIRCLLSIALPLSRSVFGTLALLQTYGIWNDLVWPITVNVNPDLRTIMVGLLQFRGLYRTEYGPLYAGYVIASVPLILLFAFTSRLFIRGLTSGAIKM